MTKPDYFTYMKRSPEEGDPPWVVFRETRGERYAFEKWEIDRWVDAFDSWWASRQEYDYWDISEDEALSWLPILTERHIKSREVRREAEAKCREQLRFERIAEINRRNELNDWSQLELAAIKIHELFTTFVTVGFSEDQAISLITGIFIRRDNTEVDG